MPAIMAVTLRLPAELGERFYAVVPAGSRNAWLVRVVEQALSEAKDTPTREQADPGVRTPGEGRSAAPAEQPVHEFVPPSTHNALVEAAKADAPFSRADAFRRASSLAKRDVQPVPKGGKS